MKITARRCSIPDDLMVKYYELVTDLPPEELNGIKEGLGKGPLDLRDAKMRLAQTFVRM